MNKLNNKFRAIIAIAMIFCGSLSTLAYDFVVDGIYYSITSSTSNTVSVTYKSYSSSPYAYFYEGDIVIPSLVSYNGITYSVTSISDDAFYGNKNLTSISIPNSVTSIGNSAFSYCEGLKSAIISNSIKSFGRYAFNSCSSLTSITIPNSVNSIGTYAFSGCTSLNKVIIEDGNKTLNLSYNYKANSMRRGEGLFNDCPIDTLHLGRNLSYEETSDYGYSPFYWLETLNHVTIGDNVTSLNANLFRSCQNLSHIIIPSSVTTIEKNVFANCSFTSITIPNSIESIGECAFHGCSDLKELILEDGYNDLLLDYDYTNLDNSSYYSPQSLFKDCPIETLYLGRNVKFNSESKSLNPQKVLKNLTIGNSVTTIGDNAFINSVELTGKLTIPNSVISIGNSAFSGCNGFIELDLPNSLLNIGESAFSNCSGFSSVIIPNSVTMIENNAFKNCTSLTSVSFGNSVETIGASAFGGCNNLLDVKSFNPMPQNIDANAFSSTTYTNAVLTVPYKCNGIYAGRTGWGSFNTIIEMEMPLIYLTIKLPESGVITHKEVYDEVAELSFKANDGWQINTVSFNEDDVTSQLDDDGNYTTPVLTEDATLTVVFEKIPTGVEPLALTNDIKVYAKDGLVEIVGANADSVVNIYDTMGISKYVGKDNRIYLEDNGIYVLTVEGRTFKFAM